MSNIFLTLLPTSLLMAGAALTGKDTNATGADDAVGQICIAMAPVIPDLVAGGTANKNAVLKAMRAIEQTAHAYRVQMEDPTL